MPISGLQYGTLCSAKETVGLPNKKKFFPIAFLDKEDEEKKSLLNNTVVNDEQDICCATVFTHIVVIEL